MALQVGESARSIQRYIRLTNLISEFLDCIDNKKIELLMGVDISYLDEQIKNGYMSITKTALLAKGFREAGQTAANAFRTFADKPEVDYSQKEQKHPITKAVPAPMKAVKKMLVSMELHLEWCTECEMSAPSAYDIDIEAGDIDVTDTVTVVWEIS